MGLNDISLPPHLLADLYSNVLIETNTTVMPGTEKVKFLGKNEKKILVVASKEDAAFLPEQELNFLTNILTACSLSLADVAIVNKKKQQLDGEVFMNQLESNLVLLFDVTPEAFGLPINFPEFQVQSFNGRTFLHGPSLTEIEANVELKKQLWAALKKLLKL